MFKNNLQNFNPFEKNLTIRLKNQDVIQGCDGCESDNFIESGYGLVCRNCGLTINMPFFRCDIKYNQNSIQTYPNKLKKATKIGSSFERMANMKSCELERMAKMQDISNNYQNLVLQLADVEFKRILTALHLPESLKNDCIAIFKKIWKNMKKGSKARAPDKLAPVVLFMLLKVKTILFELEDLLINAKNRNVFKEVLFDACLHYPAYIKRDRRLLIYKKIYRICEFFGFDKEFMKIAYKILVKFWPLIKNTKDDVVVGVVSALTVIAKNIDSVSISRICDKIGIRMSTINYQVKNHIFLKMNISGFTSLKKSYRLIKNVVENMVFDVRVVNTEKAQENYSEEENKSEIVVFNLKTDQEHHFNASFEDFWDIIPQNLLKEPLIIMINCYQSNILSRYPNKTNNGNSRLKDHIKRLNRKKRKNSGKETP